MPTSTRRPRTQIEGGEMKESKSLQEIISITASIEEALVESSGEITPEISQMLDMKYTALPDKIDRYYGLMERMKSLSEYYEDRSEMFLKMSKSVLNIHKFCNHNIESAMRQLDTKELKGYDFKFKLQDGPPSLDIYDHTKIPEEYKKTTVTVEPDKTKIKEALKQGIEVNGAKLVTNQFVRKGLNTTCSKKIDRPKE